MKASATMRLVLLICCLYHCRSDKVSDQYDNVISNDELGWDETDDYLLKMIDLHLRTSESSIDNFDQWDQLAVESSS